MCAVPQSRDPKGNKLKAIKYSVRDREQQEAFDSIKVMFCSEPILKVYNPELPTRVECDASGFATGGILSQKHEDGLWHPVAYRSQSMSKEERNYEIYDREMLG